jgi:hypothetical protein
MEPTNSLNGYEDYPRGNADDCEELRALIPAYSLGATDPGETRFVESLLERCPEEAAELATYDVLAEKLLYSAPPTTAPAYLREKVLASVKSGPEPATSVLRAHRSVEKERANPHRILVLVAAVLAIALLSLANLYWAAQISTLRDNQQEITRQLNEHTDVLTLIGAGETQRIDLWSSDRTTLAVMLCDPEEPLGFVYAEDFPRLPPGMVYQLWLVRGQERIGAGTFLVDENGEGSLVFHADEPLARYQAAEITPEMAGAVQPASPVLVRGLLNY